MSEVTSSVSRWLYDQCLKPEDCLVLWQRFRNRMPAHPSLWHVLAAVTLVYANSWVWHGSLAFALSLLRVQSAYLRNYQFLTKCSAVLFGGFGIRLLIVAIQKVMISSA